MKNLSEITHELDVVTKKYVDNAAEAKVDKVEGKQLSTNDYTTEEKNKLNSLENYTLPAASADALGGVKIGNNLAIDENGVLNIDDIDYNELENKPTLNGVAITGNLTSEDLGINSSNISYGSGEPEDENAVVWIDPSGEPVVLGGGVTETVLTLTEHYAANEYVAFDGILEKHKPIAIFCDIVSNNSSDIVWLYYINNTKIVNGGTQISPNGTRFFYSKIELITDTMIKVSTNYDRVNYGPTDSVTYLRLTNEQSAKISFKGSTSDLISGNIYIYKETKEIL